MQTIIIAENPFDAESWKSFEDVSSVKAFLKDYFPEWPKYARIYQNKVAEENDITPHDAESVEKLDSYKGIIYVVCYPADPVTVIVAIVAVVAIAAAAFLLMPSVPTPSSRINNNQYGSANNELSERTNKVRINNRIPDIFGTVRSVPDLISVPYKIFEDNQEVEIAYMCIGRGEYEISDIKDGDTLIEDIESASVVIYGPNTSPNSGTPQQTIGSGISDDVLKVKRLNEVNGQVLRAPNIQLNGNNNIKFKDPNKIIIQSGLGISFTDFFQAGDSITISNASYTGATAVPPPANTTVNLAGTYTISTVTSTEITLLNPASVNADWNNVTLYVNDETAFISPILANSGNKWIGPFTVDVTDLDQLFGNFIALNGLYKDDGNQQYKIDIVVEIELTPVDSGGTPTGPVETFQGTIEGSSLTRDTRALTIKANPTFTGRCKVRARRVTDTDRTFNGQVVDEIKWRDAYAISPVTNNHFGDVTTIHSKTYATSGALSVKERKLNMLVTRKIPQRISGSTFTSTLYATNKADEIISFICLDQFIGNRNISEIDFDSIYNTIAAVNTYFGTTDASEFSYTFDKDNISFQETIAAIAEAVFCTAYRQGNIIKLNFEKATEDSLLIFNHRNKLPGSETRTIRFGNQDNNDGIELDYVDSVDDSVITLYLPEDRSAINARKIETLGIRNYKQAYWQAYRVYNKIQYQNTATEFEATQEASTIILKDRILVADNTRPFTQDGEVLAQNVLELTLSQPVTFEVGKTYVIFLQLYDGTVQSIPITAGSTNKKVILSYAPSLSLVTDDEMYAKTTYIIVANDNPRTNAFLVSEKEPKNNFEYTIRAVNYSPLYYQNDELQLWFNFNDQTYNDKSAFLRNGTKIGSGSIVNDATRGYVYQGVTAGDKISLPASFNAPASYTKIAWVYSTGNATHKNILSDTIGNREVFYLSASSGNLEAGHNAAWVGISAPMPSLNTWHHVALTYDAATLTMKLYINGVLVDTASSVAQRTLGNVQIGCYGASSDSFINGKLDDVRLYKRALTDDEIKQIYRTTII